MSMRWFDFLKIKINQMDQLNFNDDVNSVGYLEGGFNHSTNESFHENLDEIHDVSTSSSNEDDWWDRCPNCGALNQYSKPQSNEKVSLGLGQDENCYVCGADSIYSIKKPLHKCSRGWLLQELKRVEDAYLRHVVTKEEGSRNRAYFSEILTAIGEAHQDEKVLWSSREEHREYESKYRYAIDLVGEVYSGRCAKYYWCEGLPVSGKDELDELITELESQWFAQET